MSDSVTDAWSLPAESVLGAREAHLWRFTLDPPAAVFERFAASLSDDEHRRAERFRAGHLRRRYIAGRGGLRAILASYLGVRPDVVAFQYGPHGKPSIASESTPPFEFNLSHTHELAVCALCKMGRIGVDVEEIRPMEEHGRKLIGRFFSEVEQSEYLEVPEPSRLTAFFKGWTRKEAYLKAVGTGLATVLSSCCASTTITTYPSTGRCSTSTLVPDMSPRWRSRRTGNRFSFESVISPWVHS